MPLIVRHSAGARPSPTAGQPTRWQATCAGAGSVSGGSWSRQTGIDVRARVWKRQPGGGGSALGISPDSSRAGPRRRALAGWATGTAAISACV